MIYDLAFQTPQTRTRHKRYILLIAGLQMEGGEIREPSHNFPAGYKSRWAGGSAQVHLIMASK